MFLRARYYAPSMGRFMQMDPSRQERNPYWYAFGSPMMYADPSGLCVNLNHLLTLFGPTQGNLPAECLQNIQRFREDNADSTNFLDSMYAFTFNLITAVTLLAAIGDISRFETDKKLVGYAGLGARIHDSGQTTRRGRVTKTGRKDIRYGMVQAANHAVRSHPYWKAQMARLEPRLGRSKAIVAIARRLLVAVWHVLTKECADRHADTIQVARTIFRHAYRVGVANLPEGMSALMYTRYHLDRLGLGKDLTHLPWSGKTYRLPPSSIPDD